MVMHARKIPRLNDGYYDRGESHPYEDKMSSKHRHYNDRFGEHTRDSPNFRQGGSGGDSRGGGRERNDQPSGRTSPRYQNKASYIARSKEQADKGNSNDKRANYDRARSNKDGRNREQKERDHRAEVRKTAMRVCGDWSEHISSKGKCYYYNCKTEESKWEKPKEWTEPDVKHKDPKDRKMAHSSKKVHDEKPKHSSSSTSGGGTGSYPDRHWPEHQHNSRSTTSATFGSPASARHSSQDSAAHHGGSRSSSSDPKYHSNRQSQSHVNSSNSNNNGQCSSKNASYSRSSSHGHASHSNTNWHGPDHSKSMDSMASAPDRTFTTPERPSHGYDRHHRPNSGSNTPLNWQGLNYRGSGGRSADHNGAKHLRNDKDGVGKDFQQSEDMDISPGSTPTEESMDRHISMASSSHGSHPVSSLSSLTSVAASSSQKSSVSTMLSSLSNISGLNSLDLPTLAKLSSLSGSASTSPGGTTSSPASILPQLLQQLARSGSSAQGSSKLAGQQVLQQAIQVLQKLQQNIVVQQKQQQQRQLQQQLVTQLHQLQTQLQQQQQQQQQTVQHRHNANSHPTGHSHSHGHKMSTDDGSQSPYSPPDDSDGTPLQSPEYGGGTTHHHHHHHSQHHHTHDDTAGNSRVHASTGRESPRSEHSIKSSSRHVTGKETRESPTHSHTSSQNLSSVGTSQLSAAHRKDESVHLTPSLGNYYDDSLIGHVSGLIYDQSEKQSDIVAKDVHTICNEQCTQVAAELKGARSLVRVGEIISTLHEQRILFIRQQIKDLDGWRTHNTFMPSSSSSSSSQPPPGGAT